MMRPGSRALVRWAARKVNMRFLRYFALAIGILLVPAAASHAQVSVGIGVGGYAPVYGPPACSYGYYDYAPYACAPYGYYGPTWFNSGIFIGAGPWFHGGYGYGRGYGYGYGHAGYYGRGGYAGGGYHGGGYAGGGYHGGGGSSFHGGGGGSFHGGGGGGSHGGGGGRR